MKAGGVERGAMHRKSREQVEVQHEVEKHDAPVAEKGEKKELSPELAKRLLAFDNAADEYLTFMHETYYPEDEDIAKASQEIEEYSAEARTILGRLFRFITRDGESDAELSNSNIEMHEMLDEKYRALEQKKHRLERKLSVYSDIFEDPLEAAYLSALDKNTKGKK